MIVPGLTDTCRAELLFGGIHLPQHEYYLALYADLPEEIVLGPDTIAYTPENEVVGLGYEAGGKLLEGRKVEIRNGVACLDFIPPVWPVATILRARGCLIYNRSLEGLNSFLVHDFGDEYSSVNGPFIARLPQPGPDTSLIQWA